jgi:hypothetical protein
MLWDYHEIHLEDLLNLYRKLYYQKLYPESSTQKVYLRREIAPFPIIAADTKT